MTDVSDALTMLGGHDVVPPTEPTSTATVLGVVGAAAALVATGVGWVVWRRQKLARQAKGRLASARATAEQKQADVVLAAEGLPAKEASEVQLEAARLGEELTRLRVEEEGNALTLGKIEQIESELAALHSTTLQRSQRRDP